MGSRNTFLVLCVLIILLMTSVFAQPRIAGGQRAHLGQFKFVVALDIQTVIDGNDTKHGECSGSLLSESWVLSAAHCLVDYILVAEIMRKKNTARTQVLAGDLDSDNAFKSQTTTGQMRLSFKNYTHPGAYNLRNLQKIAKASRKTHFLILFLILKPYFVGAVDIALFQLDTPFSFGSDIGSIKLAKYYNSANNHLNCVAVGFGAKNYSHASEDDLNYIPVTIGGMDYCKIVKPGIPIRENYTVCVRGKKEFMNLCGGDSGGPVTCGEDGQEQFQYGVLSTGAHEGDANYCGKSHVITAGYIFPNYAADWIANITGLVDFQQPTSKADNPDPTHVESTAPTAPTEIADTVDAAAAPASCGPFLALEATLFALVVFKSSWDIINY